MAEPQSAKGAPAIATLTIAVKADGRVEVTGPLDQKMLCYGMLEVARDRVQEFKVEMPRILQPSNGLGQL